MSLEQALADQTAAIKEQTAALIKLTTAIAVIASTAGKGGAAVTAAAATIEAGKVTPVSEAGEPVAEPEAPKAEEKKKSRRELMDEVPRPKDDKKNLPPADAVLPEGERNEDYYKAHVQPCILELAGYENGGRDILIAMYKKLGIKDGKDLRARPSEWDVATIGAKTLLAEAKARDANAADDLA